MENHWKIIGSLIVTAFLSTFITQNTNALVLTKEVEPTGTQWIPSAVQCLFTGSGSWVTSSGRTCTGQPSDWDGDTYGIRTTETFPVKEGNYYQVYFILRNPNQGAPNLEVNPIFWNFTEANDFTTVALEEFYASLGKGVTYCQTTYQSGTQTEYTGCTNNEKVFNKIYIFTLRAKNTANIKIQVGSGSGVLVKGYQPGVTGPSKFNYTTGITKIVELAPISNTEEAEQKTEEASNEGEQNSNSADSDNEEASENVIGVISNVIGAFNTAPTNCTLPGNLGNLNMGNLNLCQGKPGEMTQIINIVGSIIIVYACYRVARNIFRIWITITAFAQGNGKGNTD